MALLAEQSPCRSREGQDVRRLARRFSLAMPGVVRMKLSRNTMESESLWRHRTVCVDHLEFTFVESNWTRGHRLIFSAHICLSVAMVNEPKISIFPASRWLMSSQKISGITHSTTFLGTRRRHHKLTPPIPLGFRLVLILARREVLRTLCRVDVFQ